MPVLVVSSCRLTVWLVKKNCGCGQILFQSPDYNFMTIPYYRNYSVNRQRAASCDKKSLN